MNFFKTKFCVYSGYWSPHFFLLVRRVRLVVFNTKWGLICTLYIVQWRNLIVEYFWTKLPNPMLRIKFWLLNFTRKKKVDLECQSEIQQKKNFFSCIIFSIFKVIRFSKCRPWYCEFFRVSVLLQSLCFHWLYTKRIEYILEWNLLEKSEKRPFYCTVSILQVYFTL